MKLLFILLLDVTCKMDRRIVTERFSPMQLILQKYKEYMNIEFIYNRKNDKTYIMVQNILSRGGISQIEKSYLEVAVNFPYFLEAILENIPENQVPEYYRILPDKVNRFFDIDFVNMGFVELMLYHCDGIILKMINNQMINNQMINNQWPECNAFLKGYKDRFNQTPLHSAAKLFKPHIVEKLMDSRYIANYVRMYVCKYQYVNIDYLTDLLMYPGRCSTSRSSSPTNWC